MESSFGFIESRPLNVASLSSLFFNHQLLWIDDPDMPIFIFVMCNGRFPLFINNYKFCNYNVSSQAKFECSTGNVGGSQKLVPIISLLTNLDCEP